MPDAEAHDPTGSPIAAVPPLPDRPAPPEWREGARPEILRLFAELSARGVRHCHFKSNIRLGETLAGLQDIDLLVDRRDQAGLLQAVAAAGFKPCLSQRGVGHPGVFHAIGLDRKTGRLIDLHVHFAVVGGDSLVKNTRFPLAALLLGGRRSMAGVPVPSAEAELLSFVARVALKHTSLVEVAKINRRYSKTVAELAWLRAAADAAETDRLRARHLPEIDDALWTALLAAAARRGAAAVAARVRLGLIAAWRLRRFRRLDPVADSLSRLRRVLGWIADKAAGHGDLSPLTGGAIVAVVGPKGTGKSTLSAAVAERLGRHLDVRAMHVGKPPATVLSALPRLFVPLARRLLPHERLSEYETPERRQRNTFSLFHVVRMTLLAHDRRRLLRRAFRHASRGRVVVCDRYPSRTDGAIDSSRFDAAAVEAAGGGLKRWLMQAERRAYAAMPVPDIVLRLEAPLAVALGRDATRNKAGGPDPAAVRRRWDLERMADFPESRVIAVDTSGSLDETAARAVAAVWEAL